LELAACFFLRRGFFFESSSAEAFPFRAGRTLLRAPPYPRRIGIIGLREKRDLILRTQSLRGKILSHSGLRAVLLFARRPHLRNHDRTF